MVKPFSGAQWPHSEQACNTHYFAHLGRHVQGTSHCKLELFEICAGGQDITGEPIRLPTI
jgi:hypothetical protein